MSLCWRFSRNSLDYTDSIERSKVAVYRRVIGRDNPGNETHRTHAGPQLHRFRICPAVLGLEGMVSSRAVLEMPASPFHVC
jgi:hypothetical protein